MARLTYNETKYLENYIENLLTKYKLYNGSNDNKIIDEAYTSIMKLLKAYEEYPHLYIKNSLEHIISIMNYKFIDISFKDRIIVEFLCYDLLDLLNKYIFFADSSFKMVAPDTNINDISKVFGKKHIKNIFDVNVTDLLYALVKRNNKNDYIKLRELLNQMEIIKKLADQ